MNIKMLVCFLIGIGLTTGGFILENYLPYWHLIPIGVGGFMIGYNITFWINNCEEKK